MLDLKRIRDEKEEVKRLLTIKKADITLLEKVIVISFAMPSAASSAIFSQQYKGEDAFATKSVLMTTVCSVLTIPIFAIIMEL